MYLSISQMLKLNALIYNTWMDERLSMANVTECWQNASEIDVICASPKKYTGLRHKEIGPILKVSLVHYFFMDCKLIMYIPATFSAFSGCRSWLFRVWSARPTG